MGRLPSRLLVGTSAPSRDKIDTGPTHDKVKAFDPAMSPLGTDEEAASPHDEEGLKKPRERRAVKFPARSHRSRNPRRRACDRGEHEGQAWAAV